MSKFAAYVFSAALIAGLAAGPASSQTTATPPDPNAATSPDSTSKIQEAETKAEEGTRKDADSEDKGDAAAQVMSRPDSVPEPNPKRGWLCRFGIGNCNLPGK